ncbi:hypothetical protein SBA3_900006 [Candidatus Sulfopaludibacter sp. SbA3]|nr:hypothetical protein SBA3_900006 [Candidatus Sulfopaludibacter sp. SbA3]
MPGSSLPLREIPRPFRRASLRLKSRLSPYYANVIRSEDDSPNAASAESFEELCREIAPQTLSYFTCQ